jgi:hypothetical protein
MRLVHKCQIHVIKYLEKRDNIRSILNKNMIKFKLIQALNESNSHTSYIAILCCDFFLPQMIVGCYLYSSEKRLIDMPIFLFCYNLNKRVPD